MQFSYIHILIKKIRIKYFGIYCFEINCKKQNYNYIGIAFIAATWNKFQFRQLAVIYKLIGIVLWISGCKKNGYLSKLQLGFDIYLQIRYIGIKKKTSIKKV